MFLKRLLGLIYAVDCGSAGVLFASICRSATRRVAADSRTEADAQVIALVRQQLGPISRFMSTVLH